MEVLWWKKLKVVLERSFSAKMGTVFQVPRRKEFLEYPRNYTTGYRAFKKITMDLGVTSLGTIK